jgi:TRAP-type C4-dicarboxylate transport system substrate-binding protein
MRLHFRSALCAAVIALATTTVSAAEWVMPTPYGAGNFQTQNAQAFADEVARETNGAVTITLHPAGSLYAHGDIPRAVMEGDAQIGEVLLSTLSSMHPAFGADSLPFVATTYSEASALWEEERDVLTRLMRERGLIPLYAVPWPPQGLYSLNEMTSGANLRGTAFRTYNAMLDQLAQSVGARPTQVEVKDIPDAFRDGRIDVMLTSATTGVITQAWDYLDVFYDIQAWLPKNIVFVNAEEWNKLDRETQVIILRAARNAEDRGWLSSMVDAVEAVKTLFDNGMVILTTDSEVMTDASGGQMRGVDPQLVDALRNAAQQIKADWIRSAGADGQIMLRQLN